MCGRPLSLAFLVVLTLRAGSAAGQTPIFLLDTDEATFASVFRVDPVNGQLTLLGSLPADLGPIASLAAATPNLLHAVTQGGQVLEISVSPFGSTSLGSIGANSIVGLAFAEGALYAVDEGTDSLYRIELAPLSVALLGAVRFPDGAPLEIGGGDLAQDDAGDWYLWTNTTQALYRLDVSSAVVAAVPAQSTGLGFTTGLAFDYEVGALLGSSRDFDALQTLDPASGQALSAMTFCAACPAAYDASYGDLASPVPDRPCPRARGFWRAHLASWPVHSLKLGNEPYRRVSLRMLLMAPVQRDASLKLAHQLIAAKLNVAAGSDPTPVAAAIADADTLLGALCGRLPHRVRPPSPSGQAMLREARALEAYNNGLLTPFCVP